MTLFRCLAQTFLLLATLLAAPGCGGDGNQDSDGGVDPGDDASSIGEAPTLTLLSPETLELGFGETRVLELSYTLPDGSAAAEPVSFAIEGRAGDSSLSDVSLLPDARGNVSTTLRAGTVGAVSFRVRASAPGAANAYVEVSVGDRGFASLSVVAEYYGTRDVWGCEVRLYTEHACGELDPRAPPVADRSVHVGGPMVDDAWTAVFPSLSVGLSYTVLVMGLGESGGVVASGCVPAVTILTDPDAAPMEILVSLADQPYGTNGRFALASSLDLTEGLAGRVDAWMAPTTALLADGTATFLLDELALYLAAHMPEQSDEAFQEQRPALEGALAERFAARDADPSVALAALAADLEDSLGNPVLQSELLLDQVFEAENQVSSLRFSHEARALDVTVFVDGVQLGMRTVTFGDAGLVSLSSGGATTTADRLALGMHALPFRIGTLASTILQDALVVERGAASLEGYLGQVFECGDLGAWLAAQSAGVCDDVCWQAACEQAAAHLAAEVDLDLRAGDVDYDTLTLTGSARLSDADGDVATDALEGGVWEGLLTGALEADVTARFEGVRNDVE